MRNELVDFGVGFLPFAVPGVALFLFGWHRGLVYCGTYTPIPPCFGTCVLPCAQVAWVPHSWSALYLLPLGVLLGAILVLAGVPLPRRSRSPPPGEAGPSAAVPADSPERNASTTTYLLGVDTMVSRRLKGTSEPGFPHGFRAPESLREPISDLWSRPPPGGRTAPRKPGPTPW